MEWIAYGIPIVILLGALAYGVMKSGRLSRGEKAQLERNTKAAQKRDDPQK